MQFNVQLNGGLSELMLLMHESKPTWQTLENSVGIATNEMRLYKLKKRQRQSTYFKLQVRKTVISMIAHASYRLYILLQQYLLSFSLVLV